jgi:membrane protein DedA with SNARE-associated domain
MSDLISLISRHGYGIVAALVFAEAIGLPVPAALALVAAGAAAAAHVLRTPILLPLSMGAMVLGDTLLYLARQSGDLHSALGRIFL